MKIPSYEVKVDPVKNKLDKEMITKNQNNISNKVNEYNENVVDADAEDILNSLDMQPKFFPSLPRDTFE